MRGYDTTWIIEVENRNAQDVAEVASKAFKDLICVLIVLIAAPNMLAVKVCVNENRHVFISDGMDE